MCANSPVPSWGSNLLSATQWDGSPGLALAPLSSAPQCLVRSRPFNRDLGSAGRRCVSYALENDPLTEAESVLPMVIWREFFILKFQHLKRSAPLLVEMQTLGLGRGQGLPGSPLNSRLWGTRPSGGGKNQNPACLLPERLTPGGPSASSPSLLSLKTQPTPFPQT